MTYNKNIPYNDLPLLPPNVNFDDVELLKLINKANNSIFELKGVINILPNKFILLSPLSIKEGVASSSVENINTTVAEALKADILYKESELSGAEKEVLNYREAIFQGFGIYKEKGFIATNDIVKIQSILEPNKKGIRTISDVKIRNSRTNKVVYFPPVGKEIILDKLKNFEQYFNDQTGFDDLDPLVRVAIMHYQFEAIHPFLDGNGRTGRILMVLYLTMTKRLDVPTLFISKYILDTRDKYYKLLAEITEDNNWIRFVKYIVKGIDLQAKETAKKILEIQNLIEQQKHLAVSKKSKILDNYKMTEYLFSTPFYTQERLSKFLSVHRNTAARYFKELDRIGLIEKFKHKNENIYYNKKFLDLLSY